MLYHPNGECQIASDAAGGFPIEKELHLGEAFFKNSSAANRTAAIAKA